MLAVAGVLCEVHQKRWITKGGLKGPCYPSRAIVCLEV